MFKLFKKQLALVIAGTMLMPCFICGTVYATEVTFSSIIMNVGADETERNITWYSEILADGEIRYAKASEMTGSEFPSEYVARKARAVKTLGGKYTYKATMTGLEENTEYVYCLVTGEAVSEIYNFKVRSYEEGFSFAYFSDPQLDVKDADRIAWEDSLSKVSENFPNLSFMVSGGDQIINPILESNYDYFIRDTFKSLAVATTIGPQHDNASLYAEHYNLPNLSSKYGVTDASSDYFYKYNNVLFMHLNVESTKYDDHKEFMRNTIADNPDCAWRIVVLHYSFLSGGHHSADTTVQNFRTNLAGEMNSLGIDLVLSGHDHAYARSYMMLDGSTKSDDVITGNSVTDPKGTMYICGATASGTIFYDPTTSADDKYIACKRNDLRKGMTIFDVSENALTLNTYFLDKNTPENIDSFTINKTASPLKLNGKTDMLEFGGEPLVNAYAYSSVVIRVFDSVWKISTDGGENYQSLEINADTDNYVIRTNSESGLWEFSQDGGETYTATEIRTSKYSVKYVTMPDAEYGDGTDISAYKARSFTAETPDAPKILLPNGSLDEGFINEWSWRYYNLANGTPDVTEFTSGNSYIAYLVKTEILVSHTMYISTTENPSEYTYTWKNAWELVKKCNAEEITLVLAENATLASSDSVTLKVPVNVTLDLNGHTLTTSAATRAVYFYTGSSGSTINVISTKSGSTVNAGSKDFILLGSNTKSEINVRYGSEQSYPLTFKNFLYLVTTNTSFKNSSTLNLDIYDGTYTFSKGVVYVTNVTTSAGKPKLNINAHNATFNFSKSSTYFAQQSASGYEARNNSSFTADGCVFKNTYNSSPKNILNADFWLGTMAFTNCEFDGIALEPSVLTKTAGITVGEGCKFTNSGTTFSGNPLALSGENIALGEGCIIARTDGAGSAEVLLPGGAAEITWLNPVGYTEYWKKGAVPQYFGKTSFSGDDEFEYSLVLAEDAVPAESDNTYLFKNADGRRYRYDDRTGAWFIVSADGLSETKIIFGTEPIDEYDLRTDVDGVIKDYNSGTAFQTVLQAVDVSTSKDIKITLGADFTLSADTELKKATDYALNIDLAGHTLTINNKLAMTGSGFDINIYSSKSGGALVFGNGDAGYIQPNTNGSVTFGNEEYDRYMMVQSTSRIINLGQITSGTISVNYLYSNIESGSYGILRLNAKGSSAVTLDANITGCDVSVIRNTILYNSTTTLGATTNGGVFDTDSVINIKDSSFAAASSSVFFGQTSNFKDRYYGKIYIEGSTFTNYIINGNGIYSDSDVTYDYNTYPQNLPADYDPTKCITVGKGCIFYNSGTTFNSELGFTASNTSLAEGCMIEEGENCIKTVCVPDFLITSYKQEGDKATATLIIPTAGIYTVIFADYENRKINNIEMISRQFDSGKTTVTTQKNMSLGEGDRIMLWRNIATMEPLCKALEITSN